MKSPTNLQKCATCRGRGILNRLPGTNVTTKSGEVLEIEAGFYTDEAFHEIVRQLHVEQVILLEYKLEICETCKGAGEIVV